MSKALGLFSGGLDSTLAAMVLKRQGVDVTGVSFVTPFFNSAKAEKSARSIDIPLIIKDISEIHLEVLKNPRYGYGKNMNPCIDCHALMFRLANEILQREGFDFLFSGEVLGQRPMSQNRTALQTVAKHSGVGNLILRPLSAKLLPATPMEEAGLVDREQLLDIQGRTRRRQEELAREWGIQDYPTAGGGCLLTEKSFTGRLRDLLEKQPDATVTDIELLKVGRQFRLSKSVKLSLGRNQSDNQALKNLLRTSDVLLRVVGFSGPFGVCSGQLTEDDLVTASGIVAAYGKGKDEAQVKVLATQGDQNWEIEVEPMERDQALSYQVD